jgi:hypothetical protein
MWLRSTAARRGKHLLLAILDIKSIEMLLKQSQTSQYERITQTGCCMKK